MSSVDDIELVRTTGLPPSERRALERAVRRGQFDRIRPGVLVRAGLLEALRPDERRQLGAPEAVQQQVFSRAGERRAVVDFWFPEQGVVVEVDGRAKYEDPTMLDGLTTAEAHWREKQREDFVRSFPQVRTVVRVTWADLMDLDRLRQKLTRAGVPCR